MEKNNRPWKTNFIVSFFSFFVKVIKKRVIGLTKSLFLKAEDTTKKQKATLAQENMEH